MKTITKSEQREILDLASRREALGLALRTVADDTGISNPYICQLESGRIKEPSFTKVVKLHNYYRALELKNRKKDGKSKKRSKKATRTA